MSNSKAHMRGKHFGSKNSATVKFTLEMRTENDWFEFVILTRFHLFFATSQLLPLLSRATRLDFLLFFFF